TGGRDLSAAAATLARAARAIVMAAPADGGVEALVERCREAAELLRPPVDTPADPDAGYWSAAVIAAASRVDEGEPAEPDTLLPLARRLTALADSMQFAFLYDRRRRIFAIGYRLADADTPGRLDGS